MHIWHSKSDEERPCLEPCNHPPHLESEILFIFSGNVEFIIEGYRYALLPESLLLIPPETMHGWKLLSAGLFHRLSIHFLPEYLDKAERSLFLGVFSEEPRYFPSTSSWNINFFIQTLINSMHLEEALRPVAIKSRLLSLLTELRVMLDSAGKPVPVDERVLQVIRFIQEHLQEQLSLEGLARRFNIDKNHLNTLFRQATGGTVNRYIRLKRLVLARQEILQQGANMEEAAYRAGFNDYSNFYRAYRAVYGSMPSSLSRGLRSLHAATDEAQRDRLVQGFV